MSQNKSYCGGSYIDSADWVKDKKVIINPIIKKDNECFQCPVRVALNHEEIGKHAERITKIKPFMNKYKWEGIILEFNNIKNLIKHSLLFMQILNV